MMTTSPLLDLLYRNHTVMAQLLGAGTNRLTINNQISTLKKCKEIHHKHHHNSDKQDIHLKRH